MSGFTGDLTPHPSPSATPSHQGEGFDRENAIVRALADRYNARKGTMNAEHIDWHGNLVPGDGIDCPECLNKGSVYVVKNDSEGRAHMYYTTCECMKRRVAVRRIRESGMESAVQRCTFPSFEVKEDWQRQMKDTALSYLQDGVRDGAWLYIGGQSGCGKTHICTAVAGTMLRKMAVRYMAWPHEAQGIKAVANDAEQYRALVKPLQEAEALYIDDFLKPVVGRDGVEANATAADLRLAFDILNLRYLNRKPTIISSEWFMSELGTLDEAIAGRISEMCGRWKLDIGRDKARNYRLNGGVI